MNLKLEKIIIIKKGSTGEVSVKYNLFSINKIIVDLNSAVDPVKITKYEGICVITGQLINDIKEQIIDVFQDVLADAPDGMYEGLLEETLVVNKI